MGAVRVGRPGRTVGRGDLDGGLGRMGRGKWIGRALGLREKIRCRDRPEDDSMGHLSTKPIPAPLLTYKPETRTYILQDRRLRHTLERGS